MSPNKALDLPSLLSSAPCFQFWLLPANLQGRFLLFCLSCFFSDLVLLRCLNRFSDDVFEFTKWLQIKHNPSPNPSFNPCWPFSTQRKPFEEETWRYLRPFVSVAAKSKAERHNEGDQLCNSSRLVHVPNAHPLMSVIGSPSSKSAKCLLLWQLGPYLSLSLSLSCFCSPSLSSLLYIYCFCIGYRFHFCHFWFSIHYVFLV